MMPLHIQVLRECSRYSTCLCLSRDLRKIDVLATTSFSANLLICVSLIVKAF